MKRKDDLELFHQFKLLPQQRLIEFTGDVDEMNVSEAVKNLILLDVLSDEPITVYLNTLGGDVYDGMALYDVIKSCRSEVHIIATGKLMSMGVVIMQAATTRTLTKNCRIMMHYGSSAFEGNDRDHLAFAEDLKEMNKRIIGILMEKIKERNKKYTRKHLEDLLAVDTYMWPDQFISLGLADNILGEK